MSENNKRRRNLAKGAVGLWALTFVFGVALVLTDLFTTGDLRLDLLIWPFVPGEWWAPYATWQFCVAIAIWVTLRASYEGGRTKP